MFDLKGRFASSMPAAEAQKSILKTFKLLEVLGLGQMGVRGGSCTLLKPSDADTCSVLSGKLAALFRLPLTKVTAHLYSRAENASFELQEFDDWFVKMSAKVSAFIQADDRLRRDQVVDVGGVPVAASSAPVLAERTG